MKKLNIWLEATHLYIKKGGHKTGIGYFTASIITALLRQDKSNVYTVFGNLFFTSTLPREFRGARYRFIRILPGKVWNQLIKKRLMPPMSLSFGGSPDVVVFFNYVRLPISRRVKTITVIYDLAFRHYPQFIDVKNLKYLQTFVPPSLQKSDHIVTISEHARADIIKEYGVPDAKISVVDCAVDHDRFKPTAMTAAVRNKYHLPDRYILFLGTLEPRKNIIGILRAYRDLPATPRDQYPLVLAGGRGWSDEKISAELAKTRQVARVITTGYVDDEDVAAIYSAAALFVYPSFYEGFGLPVLEAMACGVPVVTANNSSLPEAAGKAAILIDAQNTKALSDAIISVLSDEKLARRLREAGLRRAAKYNWDKSAAQMQRVIEQVAGSDAGSSVNS